MQTIDNMSCKTVINKKEINIEIKIYGHLNNTHKSKVSVGCTKYLHLWKMLAIKYTKYQN